MNWLISSDLLPESSLAYHVMVVVPIGKTSFKALPSRRLAVGITTEQLSAATAVIFNCAPQTPGSFATERLPVVVITGGSVSATWMFCTTGIAALPFTSSTSQVMV